jgi:uncharacterized RDD family membrane protein YckC
MSHTVLEGVVLDGSLNDPRLYADVRRRRAMAFLIDVCFVAVLFLAAAVVVFFAGILTLGLAWLTYAILWPAVALVYSAMTVGGSSQATPGMRMMGLTVRTLSGERVTPVIAAAHAVLFYMSVSLLTPFVLVVSLISARKQLLQDIILGTVVVNAAEAPRPMRQI